MTERIYAKDLRGLDVDGRHCEVCEEHMHIHEWVDMDDNGFVEFCSVKLARQHKAFDELRKLADALEQSESDVQNAVNQEVIDRIVKAWNEAKYDIADTVCDAVHSALTDAGYELG